MKQKENKQNSLRNIVDWLIKEGTEAARNDIEKRLKEYYETGKKEAYLDLIDKTIDDILYNTMSKINKEKKKLYEENFYNIPSEDDKIKMKAYEYIEKEFPNIIKEYKKS